MEIVKHIVFTKFLNPRSCKIFVAFFIPYELHSFLLIVKETMSKTIEKFKFKDERNLSRELTAQ